MVRKIVIAFALLVWILTPAGANETVTFKRTPHTRNGGFLTLAGQLTNHIASTSLKYLRHIPPMKRILLMSKARNRQNAPLKSQWQAAIMFL